MLHGRETDPGILVNKNKKRIYKVLSSGRIVILELTEKQKIQPKRYKNTALRLPTFLSVSLPRKDGVVPATFSQETSRSREWTVTITMADQI